VSVIFGFLRVLVGIDYLLGDGRNGVKLQHVSGGKQQNLTIVHRQYAILCAVHNTVCLPNVI
jgi:hypothetical protein